MDMMAIVKRDIAMITSIDFATSILLTPPSPATAKTVKGYAGKHFLGVTEQGFVTVNTQKAYVAIAESNMKDAGLTTRDNNDDLISFVGWLVNWTDVSGQNKTYKVQQGGSTPDETTGLIKLQLGYYKP